MSPRALSEKTDGPPVTSWSQWVGEQVASAGPDSPFRRQVARLGERAEEPHPRICARYGVKTFAELDYQQLEALLVPPPERPHERAWQKPPRSPSGGDSYGGAARRYLETLRRVSRTRLGDARYAAALHDYARDQTVELVLPRTDHPAPVGPVASRLAAPLTGASWGYAATPVEQAAMERARPPGSSEPGPAVPLELTPPPVGPGYLRPEDIGSPSDDGKRRRP